IAAQQVGGGAVHQMWNAVEEKGLALGRSQPVHTEVDAQTGKVAVVMQFQTHELITRVRLRAGVQAFRGGFHHRVAVELNVEIRTNIHTVDAVPDLDFHVVAVEVANKHQLRGTGEAERDCLAKPADQCGVVEGRPNDGFGNRGPAGIGNLRSLIKEATVDIEG